MRHEKIDYLEYPSSDLQATKAFFEAAFGWEFTDYGEKYTAFSECGISGGFEYTDDDIVNGALVVLASEDLEASKAKIIAAGGTINIEIFSFPGGSRFHFIDPSGNELSVWKED